MKRIVTIQDISCVGKCSLTVALPIISACGVETAVIPTAVLSAHTAFQGYTFRDLTGEIAPIAARWKQEKLGFDAIYTGYLGSFEQLELVSQFINQFKTAGNLVIVDPVMADNGTLYPGFTKEFVSQMAKLCGKADVIVPNLTEASYLLQAPYAGSDYDQKYIEEMLVSLSGLGAKKVVLTGVSFAPDLLGVMAYDTERDCFFQYFNERLPANFHGTGDIFASAMTGALMQDRSLEQALEIAVDYTVACIRKTLEDSERRWYGVNFEQAIPLLVEQLRLR